MGKELEKYTLYGISNCDKIRKAKQNLTEHEAHFDFVDFKKSPPSEKQLLEWKSFLGELPVNRRGTTFRKVLKEFDTFSSKEKLTWLRDNPSGIIRPILEKNGQVISIGTMQLSEFS